MQPGRSGLGLDDFGRATQVPPAARARGMVPYWLNLFWNENRFQKPVKTSLGENRTYQNKPLSGANKREMIIILRTHLRYTTSNRHRAAAALPACSTNSKTRPWAAYSPAIQMRPVISPRLTMFRWSQVEASSFFIVVNFRDGTAHFLHFANVWACASSVTKLLVARNSGRRWDRFLNHTSVS